MQERQYRALYDYVAKKEAGKIDFDMNANRAELITKKNTWCNCFVSTTEMWFYIPLLFVTSGIIVITNI